MSRLKDLFKKSTNVQMSQSESADQEVNPQVAEEAGPSVPEGLWVKCPKCGEPLYKELRMSQMQRLFSDQSKDTNPYGGRQGQFSGMVHRTAYF